MIRGLAEELAQPKYSHIERERRFLIDRSRRPDLSRLASILIEDRYLTGTRLRLRRMEDDGGRTVFKLTKKYEAADSRARPMVTAYLTADEHRLFEGLPAQALTKRRHRLPAEAGEFGLDVFQGALSGLELAEIECPDAAALATLKLPDWAGTEVTDDPRFDGGRLVGMDTATARLLLSAVTNNRL